MGTICFTIRSDPDKAASCIDAIGTTSAAIPSSTSLAFIPAISAVAKDDATLKFDPQQAWDSTPVTAGICGSSDVLRSAETINSSVSFNYSGTCISSSRTNTNLNPAFQGPSILISARSSPNGGVFSVIIDGTQIKDTIDTFSAGEVQCMHRAFPPFRLPGVPGFGSRNNHTITLVHRGPSSLAPNGTVSSIVQFYSFAVPQFNRNGGTLKVTISVRRLIWAPLILMLMHVVRYAT